LDYYQLHLKGEDFGSLGFNVTKAQATDDKNKTNFLALKRLYRWSNLRDSHNDDFLKSVYNEEFKRSLWRLLNQILSNHSIQMKNTKILGY
jgi:hypothetical protein